MKPLAGRTVIEWGEFVSAPYCARLLGDLGSEVIKIEAPDGDISRRYGPFPNGRPDPEASGLFIALNHGKRSVVLDLDNPDDEETLRGLLETADIFVSNVPANRRRRLGLDSQALGRRNPRLITVGLSVFGDDGQLADAPQTALDACAVSGIANVLGEPDREPLIIPYHQADFQAGAHGAAAAMMALLHVRRGGEAQHVSVASADIMSALACTNGLTFKHFGLMKWARSGSRAIGCAGIYPYGILRCKDGAICLMGRAKAEWDKFVAAMGNPEWTTEPRFQDLRAMGTQYPEDVDAAITPWLMEHTRAELMELAAKYGFPIGPVRTFDEVLESEQFAHRGFFRKISDPRFGELRLPGVPWRAPGANDMVCTVPRLGEHTDTVMRPASQVAT